MPKQPLDSNQPAATPQGLGDPNASLARKWVIMDAFSSGWNTKTDPTEPEFRGHSPAGQNITVETGVVTPRRGYEVVGAKATTTTPILTQWTSRRRDSQEVELRTYGTVVEYFHPDKKSWETLATGFTSGKRFGHADHNLSTDTVSYVYFGNGYEGARRWSLVYARYLSDNGVNQITVQGAITLANLNFTATGSVIIAGTTYTYTGLSSQTFTGVTPAPSGLTSGDAVAQTSLAVSGIPLGNIYMVKDARLLVAGVRSGSNASQSSIYGSAVGDPTSFTFSSPRTTGQGFRVDTPEGGGAIVALAQDEQFVYLIKEKMIKTLTFKVIGSVEDVPVVDPLKPFDGKTQAIGGITDGSVFSGANSIFIMTQNKELMQLTRQPFINYPQAITISDSLKPTFQTAIFDASVGIVYRNQLFLAAKKDSNSTANDIVFVYNLLDKSWDLPYLWQVSDFNIIGNALHFGSSFNPNTFAVINTKSDDGLTMTASYRTWRESFDLPHFTKTLDTIFLEGTIKPNTTLNVSVLLDEDGYTAAKTTEIKGTSTNIIFDSVPFNLFGLSEFGVMQFGSNPDTSGQKRFRVFLATPQNQEFFNLQLEFASTGVNHDWTVVRFGVRLRDTFVELNDKFLKVLA